MSVPAKKKGENGQSGEGISQPLDKSAKVERESANLRKYQPKWRGNQPTSENISQGGGRISQPLKYQPNLQPQSLPPNSNHKKAPLNQND